MDGNNFHQDGAEQADILPHDAAGDQRRLTFLDINTFYSRRAGGIRAFYDAKIAYFRRSAMTRYILVYPGPRFSVKHEAPNVAAAEIYGPVISRDPNGYRFMLDYAGVYRVIRQNNPDVIEVGEPWLTGLFCLFLRKAGLYRGLLACYFHSDPILTHLVPWSTRGALQVLRKLLVLRPLGALFYAVQRHYDLTVASSDTMEQRLKSNGVKAVRVSLGVPDFYLDAPLPARRASARRDQVKLLFAGRLNLEKGIELVRDVVPRLLSDERVSITVIGRGGAQDFFAGLKHPRFAYRGFVEDPLEVRDIYDAHDILLAPGPFESFGLAVVEAMARGLVVVGPDSGGTGELLKTAGSPFIFRANDGEDFLRVINLAMHCDWTQEVERSRKVALERGSLDAAMERLVSLYTERLQAAPAKGCS